MTPDAYVFDEFTRSPLETARAQVQKDIRGLTRGEIMSKYMKLHHQDRAEARRRRQIAQGKVKVTK